MLYWDSEAYAEGICNHAAGSSIESFVDVLDFIIDDIIDDAVQYRRSDDDDEDGINDNEQADQYREVGDKLLGLRRAIVRHEQETGEGTVFGERD